MFRGELRVEELFMFASCVSVARRLPSRAIGVICGETEKAPPPFLLTDDAECRLVGRSFTACTTATAPVGFAIAPHLLGTPSYAPAAIRALLLGLGMKACA